MRRITMGLCVVAVLSLAVLVGTRIAEAQCAGGCYGASNNGGTLQSYSCVSPCGFCGGGADDGCEKDTCYSASCGTGYAEYCIYAPYCHQYPECYNGQCT